MAMKQKKRRIFIRLAAFAAAVLFGAAAILRKRGKKLEVLLESGNLFFDIAKPLENDDCGNDTV